MADNIDYFDGRKQYQRPQGMMWSLDGPNLTVQTQTGLLIPDGIEVGADSNSTPSFLILTDDNRKPIDFSVDRIEQRQRMINGRMRSFHIADKLKISTSWDMIPSRSFIGDPNFVLTGDYAGTSPLTSNNQKYTTDGGAGGNEILDWYENNTGPFFVYLAYDKYPNIPIKTATITAVEGDTISKLATYTAENNFSAGDFVVITGLATTYFNGGYTVVSATSTEFTVASVRSGAVTETGVATSRSSLGQYNEVVEMYISSFSHSVQRRGGSNFDFWNVSVSLEEV